MGIDRQKRLEMIIDILKEENGSTGTRLAKRFAVSRGTILKDIADLRRKGYPIQVSSMIEEDGMMAAWYELPKYLKSTSAASAAQR